MADLDVLIDLLERHNINTSLYGKDGAKSVDELSEEVFRGESRVGLNNRWQLTRYVSMLNISIVRDNRPPIKISRVFKTNHLKCTWSCEMFMEATKTYQSKDIENAVVDLISDVLGEIDLNHMRLTWSVSKDVRESESYPGLMSEYENVNVVLQGINL